MNRPILAILALSSTCTAFAAPPVKGDAKKGAAIATQICVACHGADGNGITPANPDYPKLAGIQPEYLLKQLKDFKAGKRKNDIMAGMVASLSPDDMSNLALHFAAQKSKPGMVNNPELLEAGKKFYTDGNPDQGVPACAGCHSPDGSGTRLVYTEQSVFLDSHDDAGGREHGTGWLFDNLAAFLASSAVDRPPA